MFEGKKIKVLLKAQGTSITEFADEIGENRSLVSSYLNDKLPPSIQFIYKVMTYFPELDLNYLFRDEPSLSEDAPVYRKNPHRLIKEMEQHLDDLRKLMEDNESC